VAIIWESKKTLHLYLAAQRLVDGRHHTVHNIINVGIISRGVAVTVLLDRDAVKHTFNKLERRHVGTAMGTIHCEKAQTGAVQAIQVVESVGKQLAVIVEEKKKIRKFALKMSQRDRKGKWNFGVEFSHQAFLVAA